MAAADKDTLMLHGDQVKTHNAAVFLKVEILLLEERLTLLLLWFFFENLLYLEAVEL